MTCSGSFALAVVFPVLPHSFVYSPGLPLDRQNSLKWSLLPPLRAAEEWADVDVTPAIRRRFPRLEKLRSFFLLWTQGRFSQMHESDLSLTVARRKNPCEHSRGTVYGLKNSPVLPDLPTGIAV